MPTSRTPKTILKWITILLILVLYDFTLAEPSDEPIKTDLARIREFLQNDKPAVWLFAGDSITLGGILALESNRDYTQLFEQRLRRELNRKEHIVIKTAASGWTISSLDNRLEWYLERFSPDVMSINFGMNDCCQSLSDPNAVVKWKARFRGIIDRVHSAGIPIIIHTPNEMHPENQSSDVRRRKFLPQYVEAIRELARESGAVLVDNYRCWQEHAEKCSSILDER